jgi:hypothetical protein
LFHLASILNLSLVFFRRFERRHFGLCSWQLRQLQEPDDLPDEPRWRQVRVEHEEGLVRDPPEEPSQVRRWNLHRQEAGWDQTQLYRNVRKHGQLRIVHVVQVIIFASHSHLTLTLLPEFKVHLNQIALSLKNAFFYY